jgi:hypothetical protein
MSFDKENKQEKAIKLLLFILSPLFSFLYSLRSMNTRSSYWYFFLFAALWCLALTVGVDRDIETHDAVAYRQHFERVKYEDKGFLQAIIDNYISFDEEASKDIYATTVIYGVTRLTDNYHVMFLVFGIVLSFFMLKTFRFFTSDEKFSNTFPVFLLAVMFIMHNDIWQVWGVRFITATWITLYSSFQILKNGNKKHFLLLCLTPFIHATFIIYVVLFFIARISRRIEKFWRILFIISMIAAPFALYLVSQGLSILPPNLQGAFEYYIENSYINEINQSFEVRMVFSQILIIAECLFTLLLVLLIMINRKRITSKQDYHIYLLLLVITTLAAFTSSIPSLGERSFRLTYPLIAYIFLRYFNYGKYRTLLYVYPFIFLHHFYMSLGIQYWRTNSWDFYFMTPFYTVYKYLIAF